jgi:hypothetical protein
MTLVERITLLFFLTLCQCFVQSVTIWTKIPIPGPGRCLDGTLGAYYLRPPLNPVSTPMSTFVIYNEGGGWCASDANCYDRSLTSLGSSTTYPNTIADSAWPYEGAALFNSTYFVNATIAYAKYCDGGSWASFNNTPTFYNNTRLYYLGRPMLDALFADLMPRGLATAQAVLYTGCSAGGLTTYTHIDYLASLLSPSTVLLGLADAMFAFHVPAYPGPGYITYLEGMFNHTFFDMNATASVNQACLAHYGELHGNECFYGGQVAPFVQTPMFVLNSKYDTWQEKSIMGIRCNTKVSSTGQITLCPPNMQNEEMFWKAYGDTMMGHAFALPPRHGVHFTNCPRHCQSGDNVSWGDPSTGTVATVGQAVDRWWPDALVHGREPNWVAPRYIALDSDECVRGPPATV